MRDNLFPELICNRTRTNYLKLYQESFRLGISKKFPHGKGYQALEPGGWWLPSQEVSKRCVDVVPRVTV